MMTTRGPAEAAQIHRPGSVYSNGPSDKRLFFQPKLTVGPVDDVYEREADAVAEQVMRMDSSVQVQANASPVPVQRKCAACEEEEHAQRKSDGEGEVSPGPDLISEGSHAGGDSMDVPTQSFMESRFGYDFSRVKIHTGAVAAKSAQSINALAYTSGNQIVFNAGQYAPGTDTGKRLLAHELTHVVQQNG